MIYVMGDIHGFSTRFEDILSQINLQPDDHLYILGDAIDRLPDGIFILQDLMKMPNVTMLLGNHEHMMLEAIENPQNEEAAYRWLNNGGGLTRDAFYKLEKPDADAILDYIRAMPINVEIEVNGTQYLLVHGAPECTYDPHFTKYPNKLIHALWQRLEDGDEMPEGKTVIFGHNSTEEYQYKRPISIWYGDRMIGIDCGCGTAHLGRLACIRLDDMKEFYSKKPYYWEF